MQKIIETEQSVKSAHHRIDEHDEKIKDLSNMYIALTKVDNKVTNVEKDVTEMKKDLKEMKDEPANSWRNLKWVIIVGVVTAVLGFFLGKLGL